MGAPHLASDLNHDEGDEEDNGSESKMSSGEILEHELAEAISALDRTLGRLFVSGLSAGLDIGFSLLLMAVVRTFAEGEIAKPWWTLLVANMYSFGFILVVLGRSELFTEQTSLAVLPVLARRRSVGSLARLWAIIYASNLIGAAAFAALAAFIGPALHVVRPEVFGDIAHGLVDHPSGIILVSAVLAGWLMGLLSWLVAAGRDTISQIVIVWLIATAIGLAHLHHAIVGTIEVLAGVFAHQGVTLGDYGHFLLWTTLGNALGGGIFVALLKYGQARPLTTTEREP